MRRALVTCAFNVAVSALVATGCVGSDEQPTGTAGTAGIAGATASASGASGGSQAGASDQAGGTSGAGTVGGTTGMAVAGSGNPQSGAAGAGGAPSVDYGTASPPAAEWVNVTGSLAKLPSECGNMGGVYPSPTEDLLIVGVARQGLWSSKDGAATYQRIGAGGDKILNRLSSVLWDPTARNVFWVSGIYGWEEPWTQGVFVTRDDGASFKGYMTLATIQSHNDSISVDFTDVDRKTLLSGAHEQTGFLFRSTDAGAHWTDIGSSLPKTAGFCTATLVIDTKTFLVGCAASFSGKAGAILRSTNGGESWTAVADKGVMGQPLWASDGSIYWAGEGGGMHKSTDQGRTWKQIADANTAGATRPIELPGGRLVSSAQQLLKTSNDGGTTWKAIGTAMPWDPTGVSYSPFRRAFYAWRFDCTDAVPSDAIRRFGFDFK